MQVKMVFLFLALFGIVPSSQDSKPSSVALSGGKLIVLISVDQMRADYLDRFRPVFTGGFKTLLGEGASFSDCTFEYANTETGPGHATLSTGRWPLHHGIVENDWYDRDQKKSFYCVQDSEARALAGGRSVSPKNLLTDSLGDWLKQRDSRSKVISISGKDRGAVLLGGKKSNAALWYNPDTGGFTSSGYYSSALPEWAQKWNEEKIAQSYAGKKWERLLSEEKYRQCGATEDRFAGELIPVFGKGLFPYEFWEGEDLTKQLPYTPVTDELCLSLAKRAVESEKLGQRESTDLLCLGFSSLDYVGHSCGPYSQEAADTLLRLDRSLGELLSLLQQTVGKEKLLIGLSADHGALPLVEWLQSQGINAKRAGQDAGKALREIQNEVYKKYGKEEWFSSVDSRAIALNSDLCREKKVDLQEMASVIAASARKFDFVEAAFTRQELLAAKNPSDIQKYLLNSFYPSRSGDVFFIGKENYYFDSSTGTGHGTVWRYDRAVPLVFWGSEITPKILKERAHPTDLAPTLADWAGVPLPKDLDGHSWLRKIRATQ